MHFTPPSAAIASVKPKTWATRDLIRRLPLSGIPKAVLFDLEDRVNVEEFERTGTAQCFPSRSTIAKAVGFSPRAVFEAIEELAEAQYINVLHRASERGGYRSNVYTLRYDVIAQRAAVAQTNGKKNGRSRVHEAHNVMQEAHKGYAPDAQGLCTTRISVMHEAHTNVISEHVTEHQRVTGPVTPAARQGGDHGAESEDRSLVGSERSEEALPSEDQCAPVLVHEAHNIPPGPPIPPPPPPAPVPPEPPKLCSEACGKIAGKGDHLCEEHRAERQRASAERWRTLTGSPKVERPCSVEGCSRRFAKQSGPHRLCDVHRLERKREEQRETLRRQRQGLRPAPTCSKDGCTRLVVGDYGAPFDTFCGDHLPE